MTTRLTITKLGIVLSLITLGLALVPTTSAGSNYIKQELPNTPYFDRITHLLHWVNRFRGDPEELSDYSTDQNAARTIADFNSKTNTYMCWDNFEDIDSTKCDNIGLWKHGKDSIVQFQDYVDDNTGSENYVLRRSNSTDSLLWSDALGRSASDYIDQLDGCSVWAPNLKDDGNMHDQLRNYAQFDDHTRFVVYPQRFRWGSAKEAVWDWLMDDVDEYHGRRHMLLHEQFDQIGIACNCHKAFEEFCVVELGANVRPIGDHDHAIGDHIWEEQGTGEPSGLFPGTDNQWSFDLFENRDLVSAEDMSDWLKDDFQMPNWWNSEDDTDWGFIKDNQVNDMKFGIKSWGLRTDALCNDDKTTGFCGAEDTSRMAFETGDSMQWLAKGFFDHLVLLRSDPGTYRDDYINVRWAKTEINDHWIPANTATTFATLNWNEALARAARHVLNDEGACGTYGDINSDYMPEVLKKYYAYDYEDLQVFKMTSTELVNANDFNDSPRYALEYLLSQDCLNKDQLMENTNTEVGVGCACANEDAESPTEARWTCYVAMAKTVRAREITELVPTYQRVITSSERCSVLCPYFDTVGDIEDSVPDNYRTIDCMDDEVVTRDGTCEACEELTLGCTMCGDAYDGTSSSFT